MTLPRRAEGGRSLAAVGLMGVHQLVARYPYCKADADDGRRERLQARNCSKVFHPSCR
jgi:hypothetical protein